MCSLKELIYSNVHIDSKCSLIIIIIIIIIMYKHCILRSHTLVTKELRKVIVQLKPSHVLQQSFMNEFILVLLYKIGNRVSYTLYQYAYQCLDHSCSLDTNGFNSMEYINHLFCFETL